MNDPGDRPGPAFGWWRRFTAFLSGPAGQAVQPAGRLTERRSIAPIAVPARGFAFSFQVSGVLVFKSEDLDRPVLNSLVGNLSPYARGRLKSLAGRLAREVEPHRPESLEAQLRDRLATSADWAYEWHGQRVTCRAYVRVEPDERLQDRLRPHWERLIDLDYEREIAARRAGHAAEVSAQWAAILKKLLDAPEAGGAATMTDQQLATVVREILAERHNWEEALDKLEPQDEYTRESFFDLLADRAQRRPSA